MNEKHDDVFCQLEAKLDDIKAELRRIGYWSAVEVDPFEGVPVEHRCYRKASSFVAWLQFVFLPNARDAIRSQNLPTDSQVGLMALREWDYHSHVAEAQELTLLLNEFDQLVIQSARMGKPT
jgi:uncharacterized protein YqcC (DUF446 family)